MYKYLQIRKYILLLQVIHSPISALLLYAAADGLN